MNRARDTAVRMRDGGEWFDAWRGDRIIATHRTREDVWRMVEEYDRKLVKGRIPDLEGQTMMPLNEF